jgi:hypothetical protein
MKPTPMLPCAYVRAGIIVSADIERRALAESRTKLVLTKDKEFATDLKIVVSYANDVNTR